MNLPRVRMSEFGIVLGKQRVVQGEREVGDRYGDSIWDGGKMHRGVDHQGRT